MANTTTVAKARRAAKSPSSILFFGRGNNKVSDDVATFSIPAGYTCPGALDCHAWFDRKKRRLIDGPHQQFRCFSAMTEAARPSVRMSTDRNWETLKRARTVENMAALIKLSLPPEYFRKIRVHVAGDFYSLDYLTAWVTVAQQTPDRLFYGYTKSLDMLVALKEMLPPNFVFTASRGGKHDKLIDEHNWREALVVFHPEEAEELGLQIDHDDRYAMDPAVHKFALLIHSNGPPGSKHAQATARLRKEKITYTYGRKK